MGLWVRSTASGVSIVLLKVASCGGFYANLCLWLPPSTQGKEPTGAIRTSSFEERQMHETRALQSRILGLRSSSSRKREVLKKTSVEWGIAVFDKVIRTDPARRCFHIQQQREKVHYKRLNIVWVGILFTNVSFRHERGISLKSKGSRS